MNVFSRSSGVAVVLPRLLSQRSFASLARSNKDEPDVASLVEDTSVLESGVGLTEEEIEAIRNKSRLRTSHRNVNQGLPPVPLGLYRYENTVKYKRRLLGKYGMDATNVPIGTAWPTQQEVEDRKIYESLLYPDSLSVMWEKIAAKRADEIKTMRERDDLIVKNMEKLGKWKADLEAKVAKKESELAVARERKERLIEEVRRHFGFKISLKDQRFKDLLEQKEKEQKKLKKAAKKQARSEKMLTYLTKLAVTAPGSENKQETAAKESKSKKENPAKEPEHSIEDAEKS